ncbi:hypothetical protein ACGFX2_19365 [Streptomyces goshikiensis]|uniref:hypothetical protein n=1 Tax=Streptomyces goshikiensis TaxID=1942 RepID=UPI00371464E2
MSADAAVHGDPRPSALSMRALLAAGMAASAVSTPPAWGWPLPEESEGPTTEQAAPESEAA